MSFGETTITIAGNLTTDPEVRFTTSGAAVASFTIAATPRMFDKTTGAWWDGDALFTRCSAWRDLGEHAGDSLTKGQRVAARAYWADVVYGALSGAQPTDGAMA